MVLAHAEKKISPAVDHPIGVAYVYSRGQRLGFRAWSLDIETLVGKIREDNGAVRNRIVAAAVFVHPGASVEAGRRYVRYPSIRRTAHNDLSAALLRSPLHPIDIDAVDSHLFKSNFARCDNVGRNRRLPGSVRGYN